MFRPRPTLPRSNRSTTTLFFRISSSYFNFQLSTFNSVSLTPFPAILTGHLQRPEKSATLSLAFATLTSRVKHKSCVCHSYKKHPGSHLSSQRSFRSGSSRLKFLPTRHSPLATNSFIIRTSAKSAYNSFGIRTSKTQHLKPFRIRTYEKRGRGRGHIFQAKESRVSSFDFQVSIFDFRSFVATTHCSPTNISFAPRRDGGRLPTSNVED